MFIKLHFYYDSSEVMVNVKSIDYYCTLRDDSTRIKFNHGSYLIVIETAEKIDTLIEEALEQRVTNIDNLLGITYHNYQHDRD